MGITLYGECKGKSAGGAFFEMGNSPIGKYKGKSAGGGTFWGFVHFPILVGVKGGGFPPKLPEVGHVLGKGRFAVGVAQRLRAAGPAPDPRSVSVSPLVTAPGPDRFRRRRLVSYAKRNVLEPSVCWW